MNKKTIAIVLFLFFILESKIARRQNVRPGVFLDRSFQLSSFEPISNGKNSSRGTKSARNNEERKGRLVRHVSSCGGGVIVPIRSSTKFNFIFYAATTQRRRDDGVHKRNPDRAIGTRLPKYAGPPKNEVFRFLE